MVAGAERRQRLLGVMGVTPWRLRTGSADPASGGEPANDASSGGNVECVVILPGGASERELDLVGRALRARGPVLGRAPRLHVEAQGLQAVPVARAYLVFGEPQARALGHQLPAAVMSAAHIVLVDPPAVIVADAAAKRRLWQGLRAIGRALRRA